MLKSALVAVALLLTVTASPSTYEIAYTETTPIKDISLGAGDNSLYVAYSPPDSQDVIIAQLTPDLKEIGSTRLEGIVSPCLKVYQNTVYVAGINPEYGLLVITTFSADLNQLESYTVRVEEPVDVYIFPYSQGILLSYVSRFLEDGLLHQDIFIKKLDFNFDEIASSRLTYNKYWENPCLCVLGDTIVASYSFTSATPFLNRYVIITLLNDDLEPEKEVRYPKEMEIGPDNPIGKNVTQPDITVIDSHIVLFFRVCDRSFSYTAWTWEGRIVRVPGNIQAITLSEDLLVEEEYSVTEDFQEHYEPTACSAFEKVYLAHCVSEGNTKKLQIVSADDLSSLKIEPPSQWPVFKILGIALVGALLVVIYYLKSRSKKKKTEKNRK